MYRLVDIKEREERNAASQLQLKQQELTAQREATHVANQTNHENLIRLENAAETIKNLQEQAKKLNAENSIWKKFTVITAILMLILIISIVIKVLF